MAKKDSYEEFLREDFNKLFVSINLGNVQKPFLRSRWLDQVFGWKLRQIYRAIAIIIYGSQLLFIGGVILSALVSLNINTPPKRNAQSTISAVFTKKQLSSSDH